MDMQLNQIRYYKQVGPFLYFSARIFGIMEICNFILYGLPKSHLGIKDKKCHHYHNKASIWHQGTKTNTVLKSVLIGAKS